MSTNLNSIYHKGKFRDRQWAKHLRPYSKRVGNKRFRKTGKNLDGETHTLTKISHKYRRKKTIRVKIKHRYYGDFTTTEIKKFYTLRDAENSIKRISVESAIFLD